MWRVLGAVVLFLSALPVWAQDEPRLRRIEVETGDAQELAEWASVRTEREDPITGRFERVRGVGSRLSGHWWPGMVGDRLLGESDGSPFDARVTGDFEGLPNSIHAPVRLGDRVFFLSETEPGSTLSQPQIWVADAEHGPRLAHQETREPSFADQFGLLAQWDDVALYALPVGIVSENASRAVFVHADGRVVPTSVFGRLQYLEVRDRYFVTAYEGGYGAPARTWLYEVLPDSLRAGLLDHQPRRGVSTSWVGYTTTPLRRRAGRLVVSFHAGTFGGNRADLEKVVWEFDVRRDPARVRVVRDDRRPPPPTFRSVFDELVGNPPRAKPATDRVPRRPRSRRAPRRREPSREMPLWRSLTLRRSPAILGATDGALIVRVPDGPHDSKAALLRPGATSIDTTELEEVVTLPRVRSGEALPTSVLFGVHDRTWPRTDSGLRRLDTESGVLEAIDERIPTAIASAEVYSAVLVDAAIELLFDGALELVPLRDRTPHAPEEVAELVAVGGEIYFLDQSGDQTELWVTDTTEGGTRRVAGLALGEGSGTANRFAALDGRLVFTARDPEHGRELWSAADGVARLEADLFAGPESSEPREVTTVGREVWFSAETPEGGREPYRWMPGEAPELVGALNPGEASSHPAEFVRTEGGVWFAATTARRGRELWYAPDGEIPRRVTDLARGRRSSWPREILALPDGHSVVFTARFGGRRRAIYVADARDGRVRRLRGTGGWRGPRDPARLHLLGSELYFDALDRDGEPALFAYRLDGVDVR